MGIALVTGASAGLGVEFCRLFARDGHSLILVARRLDKLKEFSRELCESAPTIKVWTIGIDLGLPGAGEKVFGLVNKWGLTVDFLVNNAGFGSAGNFSELDLKRELQMVDLNVRTVVELTHLFLPAMLKRKSGRILNVGSTAGFQPGPFMATYYASKAFVNSFSEALHEELIGTGVSSTGFAPGATKTEFAQVAGADKLFKRAPVAAAGPMAQFGYRAMMCGRALAVPGFLNNFMLQSLRVSPRGLVRKVAGRINHS